MSLTVAVCGALGRMGREVVKTIAAAPDLELTGAVDREVDQPVDAGVAAGVGELGITVVSTLESLAANPPEILVDFTQPDSVMANAIRGLDMGSHLVIGTTGLSQGDLKQLDEAARATGRGVIVAPNFALGAVLMMNFAALAAKYFPDVEIIELHHEQKKDAPSGTAIKTAEMIRAAREANGFIDACWESLPGARGGDFDGIRIHSVRLPGFVAHQEVIFGLTGQTLTIRHDSTSRESFMPGVLLAIREVSKIEGLIYGLEHLLQL